MWKFYFLLFLCFCVPFSYLVVPRFFPTIPLSQLWGGIHQPMVRGLYTASILLAAAGFLTVLVYAYHHLTDSLFGAMILLLTASVFWMPFMYLSLTDRRWTAPMILVLALVGIAAAWMVAAVAVARENDRWALVGASYLCFHVVVLDFIVFSLAYLLKN